ncbi:hypothetical protein [Halobacillus mangrovi]|uniref:DUF2834 domain-containing protein n=1 Tax=Halobacillus mangrovi TaxID=402384 RepID=A0A1W5ZRV1_9BACI|nr:hypothetical protein [Halobacillus mangrovi]ARI75987.1 hypothetical protein HM131_03690 [Halobacillus mangrovi]
MIRRIILAFVWAVFVLYTWTRAPLGGEGYLQQLIEMDNPDRLLLAVFSLLGIYPVAFAILILKHDESLLPAWPFVLGSFMLGAFSLIPYFFLSSTQKERSNRTPKWLLRFFQSTILHLVLLLGSFSLIVHGIVNGNYSTYTEAFTTSQFVHVMTIDFIVLTALSLFVIGWDQWKNSNKRSWSWMGIVPVIGLIVYILLTRRKEAG